jgi:hypothetical protein
MKIPFFGLYEKLRSHFSAPTAASPRPVVTQPVMKSGTSLSKTVLPSTARKIAEPDPLQMVAGIMAKAASQSTVRIESAPVPFNAPTRPREISARSTAKLEVKTDRAISLCLGDILDRLPPGILKPRESFDSKRHILLKASELEKGMASGKPAVALTSVYQQAPEVFLHAPAPTDSTTVYLPFDKVLAQFMSLQVRSDQEHEHAVPHLETPILQVTREDKDRFGTPIEPLQSSPKPSVCVEPGATDTITAVEAKTTAVGTTQAPPIRPPIPLVAKLPAAPANPSASHEVATPSLDLPPNGTGVPASERVPASSGPPVPTPTAPNSPPPPPPIPFKVPPPPSDIRPRFIRVPGVEPNEGVGPTQKLAPSRSPDPTIALTLLPILEQLPPFQLNGSPSVVPDDARIRLPLSLIEPQLATGRVTVPAKVLQRAMPAEYRNLIKSDTAETPISLSLPEVLKHVPAALLRRREDQEQTSAVGKVETPISIAADEDAKCLAESTQARSDISAQGVPIKIESDKDTAESKNTEAVEEGADQPEQPLDARTVVCRANALPGVAACAITFADGLNLAGNLPAELGADGLCAVAASLLQKIDNHLHEPKIGPLVGMTLHAAKSITFLRRDNIVLAALHSGDDLPNETRDKLATLVEKLSRTYAESEPAHVYH